MICHFLKIDVCFKLAVKRVEYKISSFLKVINKKSRMTMMVALSCLDI